MTDAKIFSLLKKLEGQKYTVIYHSSPADVVAEKDTTEQQIVYEAQFEEVMHMGLKRALDGRERNATAGADTRPLFEKYQFWSPGTYLATCSSLQPSSPHLPSRAGCRNAFEGRRILGRNRRQ